MRLTKHRPAPPGAPGLLTGSIPAVIHQTFETDDLPPGMHAAARSWLDLNPDCAYVFSDAADRRAFLAAHFDDRVRAAYDLIPNGALQADLWRYARLLVEGGVYADADSVCRMPLAELLAPADRFVATRAVNVTCAVSNGFICVAPGHPFLEAALERAVALVLKSRGWFEGYDTTGPLNLGIAINRALGRDERAALAHGRQGTGAQGYRMLVRRPSSAVIADERDRPVLLVQYDGYRDELSGMGLTHWQQGRYYTNPYRRLRLAARAVRRGLGRVVRRPR